MTDKKIASGMPEELVRALAEAEQQRALYRQNPDPLQTEEPREEPATLRLSPEEILEECSREPETDIGNGRRLLNWHGDKILHITNVGWHGYNKLRWVEDASGAIVRSLAHQTAEAIDDEAICLDCSPDEQAKIAAGKLALARLKDMGKPPAVSSDVDEDRLAELDAHIEAMKEAEIAKVRMGSPGKTWDDEKHAEFQKLKDVIKVGKQAERERRKMIDATSSWTQAQYDEYARLEDEVAAMDAVQTDRAGRMSSRHNHAKSSAGTSRINNMLTEAIPYVSREVEDLNKDLFAVNCRTATLRFFCSEVDGARKWKVRRDRHTPLDYISKLAEAEFNPDATAPLFDQFMQRVMPNPDYRTFLQRYMGYCLLGSTAEQCLLFFYGAGRNGKSTFVDLMVDILGDYAVSMSIDSFAGDSKRAGAEATPDLARLPGARLVAASEPEMGVHLKDALIKTLTGGEPIAVRRLHQDFFELIPQFKIILSGNHKPIIRDDSDGIWRRVHLVPWEIQIPEDEVDRDLPRKLRAERSGVFLWMVRGALDYLQRGLQVPSGVTAATAEYREESDPIGAFIRNACHVSGNDVDRETPEELFNAYMRYAKREGLAEFKQATFSKRLPDRTRQSWKGPDGLMHQFRKGKSGTTFYYGIAIRDEFKGGQGSGMGEPPSGRFASDEPFPEDFP
ncbi:MAG: phage/plasmid primase, P4 family [Pseudorhizobium pelagicum]|uniref:phage/plasmid primase, P4 family n=1 Tax=Pseudorhizobium pelagicum TaxID=1509405 RepID=UPI0034610EED